MSGNSLFQNIDDGFIEAVTHGHRDELLKESDYEKMTQCSNLSDFRVQLSTTAYGNFLQNEPIDNLNSKITKERATEKYVQEFKELQFHAQEPLATFLDFITYDKMISNVVKLITALDADKDALDIMYKMHPLGTFETMGAILSATKKDYDEMYRVVLVDSPIGRFFSTIPKGELQERQHGTDYLRGLLQKNYYDAFYDLCENIGGLTFEVMSDILDFESDRLVITKTRRSFQKKDLMKGERKKLYPNFGTLVDLHDQIANCENDDDLRRVLSPHKMFSSLFAEDVSGKKLSIEKKLKEISIEKYKTAFTQQFHYGIYYAWAKLKEQEIDNLLWIAECISSKLPERAKEYVSIY